ncbi:peptidoglycan editing factor PgeF [Actibacterium sp. 188UL27-1]|uniref:peptidoglycan editing factor PgeF n=1 Tax=Actibacterium sp. 188UL27-1 TaxID=2786961 RepID=UPI0019582A60|nr:peptidoglycan editing factor PgeF [Actibacterium sp. 188UL27-1]MBM7066520.1 peptidoglycan editing factor PgeF [Actibacterium sp. 188UL27-1]
MTLEILTSDALAPLRHGFFTRHGGASSGIFSGLNCGIGSSDQADVVAINRDRVAHAMGVERDALITMGQVHSTRVATVSTPAPERVEADGIVTATPGLAVAVLTADCMPVLFADRQAGVVGVAHAGWRGALDGILERTVDAMRALGARAGQIAAVIGPSISQRAYEVGPEFMERFIDDDPDNTRFFAGGASDRVHFDLTGYGLQKLRCHGVGHAEWTRHCTYAEGERFYSYRRSVHRGEADYGRHISVIRL